MSYPDRRRLLWREGHPAAERRADMSAEERAALDMQPVVRPRDVVDALRNRIEEDRSRLPAAHGPFLNGALDALAWADGNQPAAPITARAGDGPRPTWVEIAAEIDAAEDVLYRVVADVRPQDYLVGVEHMLMWLIDDTPDPPGGPLSSTHQRS